MGSDNPKGATAPVSLRARYGRYVAVLGVATMLLFMLGTSPSIDPAAVPVRSTASPRRAGEGRGALSSMRDVATAVGEFKTKLRDVAQDLGDVGALHETTMPRATRHLDKAAKRLDEIAQLQGGARVTATSVEEDVGEAQDDAPVDVDDAKPRASGLYTLSAVDVDGVDTPLDFAAGKASLVTNVASE